MLKHLKINVVFWLSFFLPFVANAKLYLVSVGINTYPQLNKELHLTAAVSDAKTINEIYKRNIFLSSKTKEVLAFWEA